MNKINFDPTIGNFPLTIDTMRDLQANLSAANDILTHALPVGECILCGLETPGSEGYVRINIGTAMVPNYEIFHVAAGSSSATHLKLSVYDESTQNSQLASVVIQKIRKMEWVASQPASGSWRSYDSLKNSRLRLLTAPPDTAWANCGSNATNTFSNSNGTITLYQAPQVKWSKGILRINALVGIVNYNAYDPEKPLFTLPAGFCPACDMVVPVQQLSLDGSTLKGAGFGMLHTSSGSAVCGFYLPNSTTQHPVIAINAALDVAQFINNTGFTTYTVAV